MLCALSCNLNLSSYSNGFLSNVGFLSYPNEILPPKPRNFCISQSGAGTRTNSLSSKTRTSTCSVLENELRHPFLVSYLTDTCGFSLEEAVALSKKLNGVRLDRADTVLALLKQYGFDDTHITKVIRRDPAVLKCIPEVRLIPKFEFFHSIGLSGYDLANLMSCSSVNVSRRGLERRIIPCYQLLKSVLVDDAKVVAAIKGYTRIFKYDVNQRLGPNVEALRQAGLSESMISFALLNYFPLFHKPKDQFKAGVDEAIRLGYDSSRVTFVRALNVLIRMGKSMMESKVEMFKKWGFSNDEIADIFRKYPLSIYRSEEKNVGVINYLINEMGFKPSEIASCPSVLSSSLQKRIVPRTSVVRVLQLKGLLKKDLKLSSFILRPEKIFLEKFVIKYVEHVPQLLSIYEGRVGLEELGKVARFINHSLHSSPQER